MINAKVAFKDIVLIELNDLMEDIRQLINVCEERHRKDEITNYVRMENTALFHRELLGIKGYYNDIKQFDTEVPLNTEDMAVALKAVLEHRVKNHDLVPALIPLVERKIDKVFSYVRMGEKALSKTQ